MWMALCGREIWSNVVLHFAFCLFALGLRRRRGVWFIRVLRLFAHRIGAYIPLCEDEGVTWDIWDVFGFARRNAGLVGIYRIDIRGLGYGVLV